MLISSKFSAMKLFALLLFISACNSPQQTNQTPGADTIVADLNKPFTIELTTSLGTGYSWAPIDSAYKKLIRLDSTTTVNNITGKEDGTDLQIFHFTGIAKGTIECLFIRKRPWEANDKRDKEKKFTITIQ